MGAMLSGFIPHAETDFWTILRTSSRSVTAGRFSLEFQKSLTPELQGFEGFWIPGIEHEHESLGILEQFSDTCFDLKAKKR